MFKRLGIPTLILGAALITLNPTTALAERRHRAFAPRQFHERTFVAPPRAFHARPSFRTYYYVRPAVPYDYWFDGPAGYYDAWGFWHPYSW
jgi:hypothetical protein